jgi:DNA-binding response OmpR family regulator
MISPSEETSKPSLILVHQPSILRGMMERDLRTGFRTQVFDNAEMALDHVRVAKGIDVLVSELDLGSSPLGGCNVARELKSRFPQSLVFVFVSAGADDHRLDILSALHGVTFLDKPFGAFFLARRIRNAMHGSRKE